LDSKKEVNKYGLSRYIPSSIRRKVRQNSGYGCVVCGNAIYEYEHIDPVFVDARKHLAKGITLLCSACHTNKTRGLWSKEKIIRAMNAPYCKQSGHSNFQMDIDSSKDFTINVCGNVFVKTKKIIEIDDKNILSIEPPENYNYPVPRISASFFDSDCNEIAWISDNEWFGSSDAFDIETSGSEITIRKKVGQLSLVLKFLPPNDILIEKINMSYNNNKIIGTKNDFKVITSKSEVNVPAGESTPNTVPFWLSIKGYMIYVGRTNIINFITLGNVSHDLSGYYSIDGSKITIQRDENTKKDTLKFEGSGSPSSLGMHYDLPESEKKIQKIELSPAKNLSADGLCQCGTGRKYGNCCLKHHKALEILLNSSYKLQSLNFEVAKKYNKPISYSFYGPEQLDRQNTISNLDSVIFTINPKTGLNLPSLAYGFIASIYYHDGYYAETPKKFNDHRQIVISKLTDSLVEIPIISKMHRREFSSKFLLLPLLDEIRRILGQRDKDKSIGLTEMHFESIIFLKVNYEGVFLSRKEKAEIEKLFEEKSPKALKISKKLIKIVNESNPHDTKGLLEANLNCILYLNDNDVDRCANNYSEKIYESYIRYLEDKTHSNTLTTNVIPS